MSRVNWRRALLLGAGAVLGCGVAAALIGRFVIPDALRFIARERAPLFRLERRGGRRFLVGRDRGFVPFGGGEAFAVPKNPGVKRIAVVGESSADMLGKILSEAVVGPSAPVEVMNAGVGGGSLEMAERAFDEVTRYSPDLVVVVFGHNLFYHYDDSPAEYLLHRMSEGPSWLARLAAALDPRPHRPFVPGLRLNQYEDFLARAARWSGQSRVPVAVTTMAVNLWVPARAKPRDYLDALYLRAAFLRETGRRGQAVELLRSRLAAEPRAPAYWRFVLGRWLYEDGDYRGAFRELSLARDLDPSRDRASSALNGAVRRIAARQGLWLLDADRMIRESAPHGIPGFADFRDYQHLTYRNFARLGWTLVRMTAARGWTQASPLAAATPRELSKAPPSEPGDEEAAAIKTALFRWDGAFGTSPFAPWPGELEAALAARSLFLRYPNAAPERIEALMARPMTPDQAAVLEVCFARALWDLGRRPLAEQLVQRAESRAPGLAEPAFWDGVFRLRLGDREGACARFQKALRDDPSRLDAGLFLRWSEEGAGKAAGQISQIKP